MKKLNEEIREGNLKQVYLLCGEEAYLRRQYRDRVKKALIGDGDLMNLNCFEGKGIVPGEVVDLAQTMPFLAERRVLVIENSGFFKKGGEDLAAYLADPAPSAYFLFVEAEVDKRSKLYKAVTAKGRVIVSPGFTEVEQAFLSTLKKKPESDSKEEPGALPPLSQGQTFEKMKATAKEGTTSPPRHFTEDLLLSAMEHAGAKEFAQIGDVERTGLGTPATRAGVLEKLVRGGFLERKGRQLLPTKKGTGLIAVLPDTVKSASLTAQWESGLKDVERGEQSAAAFMEGIEGMVSDLVAQYRGVSVDTSMFRSRK